MNLLFQIELMYLPKIFQVSLHLNHYYRFYIMLYNDLSAVMDKHSYTVHELNKNPNASVITIDHAFCLTYDYQALAKVDTKFTLSSTRPAAGALMSFKNIFPAHMSWTGVIMDPNGAPKSICYLLINGSDDGDGNVWLTHGTALSAGTYYINYLNGMY